MSGREVLGMMARPIVAVPLLLLVAAGLAITSFWGDSVTYDEMLHLTAGFSYLKTGDFRVSPDHPPLGRMWAALPLLFTKAKWVPPDTPGWLEGDLRRLGPTWFYQNDGERLLKFSRCAMVILLLSLCGVTYAVARNLFGASAGLLTLGLSVLSPTLLAHGRLVTTDIPLTLAALLTLWTFARLIQRVTVWRFLAFAGSLSGAVLSKYSWPLVLPPLGLMLITALLLRRLVFNTSAAKAISSPKAAGRPVVSRPSRRRHVLAIGLGGLLLAATTWTSVWACYLFRFSPFRGGDRDQAMMMSYPSFGKRAPSTMAEAWDSIFRHYKDDRPMEGWTAVVIRAAHRYHLLPETYLYGLAYTLKTTEVRSGYLMGEFSVDGWRSYFPIAFAIKTTISEMTLLLAGIVALAAGLLGALSKRRRGSAAPRRGHATAPHPAASVAAAHGGTSTDPVLLIGLLAFVLVYGLNAIMANVNIGHRHLLPLYPIFLVLAGAAVRLTSARPGRYLVGGLVLWQLFANLWIHPHYLSYFNELIGGPRNGYLYLADSNIDWGQDLKRLAAYSRVHPNETIKLAYFGIADPMRYGFAPQLILADVAGGSGSEKLADLTAGTYCISVTRLTGVLDPGIRESVWKNPETRQRYARLCKAASQPVSESMSAEERRSLDLVKQAVDGARRDKLVAQLRHRKPDDYVDWSIFLYHLTQSDIDAMLAP